MSIEDIFKRNAFFFDFIKKINTKPYKYIYRVIPKPLRRHFDKKADYAQQAHVEKCWESIINKYFLNELEKSSITPKKELNGNIIWQYWGQGWKQENLPETVKLCYQSIEKYKGSHKVIRLDDTNISDYLDIPDFVFNKKGKGDFRLVFFSDLLRLMLLSAYGGVWIDATILLTNQLPKKLTSKPYFVFQRSPNTPNKNFWKKLNKEYFSWDKSSKVNILTSIMISEKNNYVINIMLDLMLIYWKTQSNISHYFFFQILYNYLVNNQLSSEKCEVIDDTLPHILFSELNSKLDESRFNEIKELSSIHKLTYIKEYKKGSFYEYLINLYKI